MEQIANAPGREESLPAPLPPETGLEASGSNAVAVIPAASRVALTLPPVLAGTINISPEGAIKTSNVSSKLGIVASPEPRTLWMLFCALALFSGVRYARRRPVLLWLSDKS